MTKTRVFAVSAVLIVVALLGTALLNRKIAPTITADMQRPHGERGDCTMCHVVKPVAAAIAKAKRKPVVIVPTNRPQITAPAVPVRQALAAATPTVPATRQLVGGVAAGATGNALQRTATPTGAARWGQWQGTDPLTGAVLTRPMEPRGFGRPIRAGAASPHEWRGTCTDCHQILQPQRAPTQVAARATVATQPPAAWNPTPPLARNATATRPLPPRDPPEIEALGMAVRPTNVGHQGMMIVEAEGMARRAGLELGDIVRAVDGVVTTGTKGFLAATRTVDPARGVVIDILRDGKAQVVILR